MQLSRYVHFAEDPSGEGVYLFSATTCGLALLEPQTAALLKSGDIDAIPEETRQELIEGGALVPDSAEERGSLLMNVIKRMVGHRDRLLLSLLPTTACNFRCPYCC